MIYTRDKKYRIEVYKKEIRMLGDYTVLSNIKIFDNNINLLLSEINLSIKETIELLEALYSYMTFGGYDFCLSNHSKYYDFGKINIFKFEYDPHNCIDRIIIYDNFIHNNDFLISNNKRMVLEFGGVDEIDEDNNYDFYSLFFELYYTVLINVIPLESIAPDYA